MAKDSKIEEMICCLTAEQRCNARGISGRCILVKTSKYATCVHRIAPAYPVTETNGILSELTSCEEIDLIPVLEEFKLKPILVDIKQVPVL